MSDGPLFEVSEMRERVAYLRETLIPDLRESGSDATADDFAFCADAIEQLLSARETSAPDAPDAPRGRWNDCWIDPVAVRIGTVTGSVIAYDGAFDLCLFERFDGSCESHEVGYLVPDVQKRIRGAAARKEQLSAKYDELIAARERLSDELAAVVRQMDEFVEGES